MGGELAFSSLLDVLELRAAKQGQQRAFTFLKDGEAVQRSITYAELVSAAKGVAAHLQQQQAQPGQRVLLLYPPGIDYIIAFFACLLAGLIAVPTYPPRRNRVDARLQAIVQDSGAEWVLCPQQILHNRVSLCQHMPVLAALTWSDSDTPWVEASAWQRPSIGPDDLAFLQYTSGSTGAPKGVMVSHANLLANARAVTQAYALTASDCVVSWLPPYHDMGLIGTIIQPLYVGIPSVLMSPMAFLQKPLRWLQAISHYQASTSGGPDFAYALCAEKVTAAQQATLDLSPWTLAFNGAESVHGETLQAFSAAFAPCGFRPEAFYPCYGLAEATLMVSGGDKLVAPEMIQSADQVSRVSCGVSVHNQALCIVDTNTLMPCASGQVGEIWVSGASVAQGYWQKPAATAATFQAHLANGDGPFLRTGDLGFLQAQALYVSGRLKDVIIIRGRNYYPEDIEQSVLQVHDTIAPNAVAAFSVVGPERTEQLVLAVEVHRHFPAEQYASLSEQIRHCVRVQHELTVAAVLLLSAGQLPKTSSGKIRRFACREGFIQQTLQPLCCDVKTTQPVMQPRLSRAALLQRPADARQAYLAASLKTLLASVLEVDEAVLGVNPVLGEAGLDSLSAIALQHRVQSGLEVTLALAEILDGPDIQQLAATLLANLETSRGQTLPDLVPILAAEFEPLSIAQQRMWFLAQLDQTGRDYLMPAAWTLQGALDRVCLERSLKEVMTCHDVLSTTFTLHHGEPRQQCQTDALVPWSEVDLQAYAEPIRAQKAQDLVVQAAHQPLDLACAPFRVLLLQLAPERHILVLTVHHLIFDGWSQDVMMQAWGQAYAALQTHRPVPTRPPIQYLDYAHWQRQCAAKQQHQLAYWVQQLASPPALIALPCLSGQAGRQSQGAHVAFAFPEAVLGRLDTFQKTHGVTLYMTLLSAFAVLLSRYSGQQDLVIGSSSANRTHAAIESLIGLFANTLALRVKLCDSPRFEQVLAEVRETTLHACEHAQVPFEQVVDALHTGPDERRPLFNVMFALQQAGANSAWLPNLKSTPYEFDVQISHFDLSLHIFPHETGLQGLFLYPDHLFEEGIISNMAQHFLVLLDAAIQAPEQLIAALPMLTPEEQAQIDTMTQPQWDDGLDVTQLSDAQVEALLREMDA